MVTVAVKTLYRQNYSVLTIQILSPHQIEPLQTLGRFFLFDSTNFGVDWGYNKMRQYRRNRAILSQLPI